MTLSGSSEILFSEILPTGLDTLRFGRRQSVNVLELKKLLRIYADEVRFLPRTFEVFPLICASLNCLIDMGESRAPFAQRKHRTIRLHHQLRQIRVSVRSSSNLQSPRILDCDLMS